MNGRIEKIDISEPDYSDGILRTVQFLWCDLNDLLEEEGRRFGIMLSYLNSVYLVYQKFSPSELETPGRIIYLLRPVIMREYKKLLRKHLSRADAVIVIIHRLLGRLIKVPDYKHNGIVKTLMKITTKLYDNIRTPGKTNELKGLMGMIELYISEGIVGRYSVDHLSILEEEQKRIRTQLTGSGVRLQESSGKVTEIVWKED